MENNKNCYYSQYTAKKIFQYADEKNIPIKPIEEACENQRGYLSRCKNGKKRLTIDAIYAASMVLGVSVEQLVK